MTHDEFLVFVGLSDWYFGTRLSTETRFSHFSKSIFRDKFGFAKKKDQLKFFQNILLDQANEQDLVRNRLSNGADFKSPMRTLMITLCREYILYLIRFFFCRSRFCCFACYFIEFSSLLKYVFFFPFSFVYFIFYFVYLDIGKCIQMKYHTIGKK